VAGACENTKRSAPPSVKGAPRQRRELEAQARGPKFASQTLGPSSNAKRRGKRRSRPISRVLSWTVIPLGATSPLRSSNLPGPDAGRVMRSLFGLAPGGVCRAGLLPGSRCALTAPFHPCHAPCHPFTVSGRHLAGSASTTASSWKRQRGDRAVRRYLSVALSVGSRRPGVTWHRALWSPDFPRHRCMTSMIDDATVWPTPPRALSHARDARSGTAV